ncbi:hypothetical protein BJ912DRAFT_1074884 [Pholiota molesta]|nr:hypothetical protein BJ912DRAFT_1074884 [Pholiota molesta]
MTSTNFLNCPDAVLVAVFTFFCGEEPVFLPRRTTDRRGILSRVDERWTTILQSTSTLWDNILFTSPPSFFCPPDTILNEFYTCTTRSGNNLLTVAFDMGRHDWVFSIVHAVILPNVGRIRKLTCPIHTNIDISAFLKIREGRFSALESLEIAFVNTWTKPISWFNLDTCLQFNALRTAPQLRNVTAHLCNGLHPIDLHLPWNQLTSLDLSSTAMTPEVFVKVLRYGAQRLEDGYFQVRFSKLLCPQRVLSRTTIIMGRLETLKLRLMYPSNDTRLFSILRFPVLRSLSIKMFDRRQQWDMSLYTNLLRASKNTLQQLHLSDFQPPGLHIFRTGQNIQGYGYPPVSRQYCHTTYRTLEKLFKIIPNAESLILPLGLPIHVHTAEKLATCDLLPRLRALKLGATIDSARHMLSVLNSRHHYISLGVGGSAEVCHAPDGPRLTVISSLGVWIAYHQYTFNAALALDQQCQMLASLGIVVDIYPTTALPLPIR